MTGRPTRRRSPQAKASQERPTRDQSLAALAHLDATWRHLSSRKATGGALAVAGFEYQFLQTILEALNQWWSADATRGDPRVFAETLSDIAAVQEDGAVVVVQVKRSLNRARVMATLDDFEELDRLAKRETPTCPLTFRIVCARGDVDQAGRWRKAWAAAGAPTRKALAARVRVSVEPDARAQVLAILANDLRAADPLGILEQALGSLMHAVADGRGAVSAAESIWSALLRATHDATGIVQARVWTDRDRQPVRSSRGPVLTGQRPQLDHLRRGYFAPRPALADRIHAEFERWRDAPPADPTRVRVFWISGPSGAGKSIALLQLLAQVHDRDETPIVYFRDAIDDIADTASWVRRAFPGRPEVIFAVDDPYPAAFRRDVSPAWRRGLPWLAAASPTTVAPLVVAAGPAEQARAFEEDFASEVEVQRFAMPLSDPHDLDPLRTWYERRTGTVATGPVDATRPLVWTLFEWSQGNVRDFALRLRDRLCELDDTRQVIDAVQLTLVLSGLGLGMPDAAIRARLSPQQRDALDGVLADSSLPLDPVSPARHVMVHPVLAKLIYGAWHAPEERATRTAHLTDALVATLDHAPSPSARSLPIRLLATQRIDDVDLQEVVDGLYAAATADRPPDADQLASWLRLLGRGYALGDRRVLDEALARLHPQATRQPLVPEIASALVSAARNLPEPDRADVQATIGRLLEAVPEWPLWPSIAVQAVAVFDDDALIAGVINWVDGHDVSDAGRLLSQTLAANPQRQDVRRAAARMLANLRHPGWSIVWSTLARLDGPSESHLALAERWLGTTSPRSWGWSFVWRGAWNGSATTSDHEALAELGRGYLRTANWSHPGFGFVWGPLWQAQPASHSLTEIAIEWLYDPQTQTDISHAFVHRCVYRYLLAEHDERRSALHEHGLNWLSQEPDHPGWSQMFRTLLDDPGDRTEVLALGEVWLKAVDDEHKGWGSVFSLLFDETDPQRQAWLVPAGRRWLRDVSDAHRARRYVFARIWAVDRSDQLRSEAMAWLDRVDPSHVSWSAIWEAIGGAEVPGGLARAERYLNDERNLDHPGWSNVWRGTWDTAPDDDLVRQALRWLQRHPDHEARGYVVAPLMAPDLAQRMPAAAQDLASILEDTLTWLDAPATWRDGGDLVWRLLRESRPDLAGRLRTSGIAWLEHLGGTDHRGWGPTLRDLWREDPSEELAQIVRVWAACAGPEALGWSTVGVITWALVMPEVEVSEPDLAELIWALVDAKRTPTSPVVQEVVQRIEALASAPNSRARQGLAGGLATRATARLGDDAALAALPALRRLLHRQPGNEALRCAVVKLSTRLPPANRAEADLVLTDALGWLATRETGAVRGAVLSAMESLHDPRLEEQLLMVLHSSVTDITRFGTSISGALAICGRHADDDLAHAALRRAVEILRQRPLDRSVEGIYSAAAGVHDRLIAGAELDQETLALLEEHRERHDAFRRAHPQAPLRVLSSRPGERAESAATDQQIGRVRRLLMRLSGRRQHLVRSPPDASPSHQNLQ